MFDWVGVLFFDMGDVDCFYVVVEYGGVVVEDDWEYLFCDL